MKSQSPNKEQLAFREDVRGLGSIISGGPAVIHHVVGRTAKHEKVAIGHWWILPLTDEEHKLLHSDLAEFERIAFGFPLVGRWDSQKILFKRVLEKFYAQEDAIPWEVYSAIMGYQR